VKTFELEATLPPRNTGFRNSLWFYVFEKYVDMGLNVALQKAGQLNGE
jgi:hypothetical protein